MLTSLDHVLVVVADLDAATATYARLLGRRPSWRGDHPVYGTANTLFRLDNTYAELIAPVGEGPIADLLRARLEATGEGPLGLSFGTDDAEGCVRAFRERGLAPTEPEPGGGVERTTGVRREWRNVLLPTTDTRGVQLFAIEHVSPADLLPVAEADGKAPVTAVDHVVILTGDADAAIDLYRDRLGLRLALDRPFDERGMRLVFFRIGGVTVELAAPFRAPEELATTDRFWGISWRVPDVDAARERVAGAGFDVSEVREGMKPGTRVCTIRSGTHGVATLFLGPDDSNKEE